MPIDGHPSYPAKALRAAGFVRTPRWWVRPEQLDIIADIARTNLAEVRAISDKARATLSDDEWNDAADALEEYRRSMEKRR